MDKCAIEILQLIFTLLSQNQIAICSLVCRSWYIAARDPLYHSIHFYSLDRVLAFIHLTPPTSSNIISEEKDTRIIRYMKTIPRGILVRKMTFHIQIKDSATWSELQIISPRVTAVDMIPENDHGLYGVCRHRYRHPLALKWPELKRLPVWHKDDYGLWKSMLSDQLLYLGLDIYFYDHLVVADNISTEESSSSNTLNSDNGSLITKTFHLPPMQCLQELDLFASRHFFLLDERNFEFIHAACPNLRIFSLTSFQMRTVTNSIHILPTKLTSLYLDRFCIHDLNSYTYLGHKYPNLKSFKVKEIRKNHHHHYIDSSDHRSAMFSLITNHFTQLTNISADLYEPLNSDFLPSPSESIWPYTELQRWLSDNSQQNKSSSKITKLHWSCLLPFDPLDDDSDNDKMITCPELTPAVFEFPNRFYFSHLTSLLLITTSNASWQQVQQLWEKQKKNTTPLLPLLETLTIRHTLGDHHTYSSNGTSSPRRKKQDFFALVRTCPKLARLEIENGLFVSEGKNWQQKNNLLLPSLKELVISNCSISLKKSVTEVCQQCPHLKRLILNHVQCQLQSPSASSSSSYDDFSFIPTKESGYSFTVQVDLAHLSLEYLGLSSLWYERMMASDQRYTKRVAVNYIKVNQEIVTANQANMKKQKAMYCKDTYDELSTMTHVSILINCRYVEQLNINQGKYS